MGYAAPAGAALCMELLDPDLVTVSTDADLIAGETYSRSSIIQQLSLLMAFFNSSGTSQPNGPVTSKIGGVIKKVLDHVLNDRRRLQTPAGPESLGLTTDWDSFVQFNPLDTINWFNQNWVTEEPTGMQ